MGYVLRTKLTFLTGITGSDSGITALTKYPGLLVSLIALLDDKSENVALNSSKCLINISADREASDKLLDLNMKEYCPPLQRPCQNIVSTTLNFVLQPGNKLAQNCLMILLNLSYHKFEKIIDLMETSDFSLDDVIDALVKKQVNNTDLDYLGPVLSNLSQSGRVRKHILNKNKGVVQRLLPFVNYPGKVLRKGLVGILKNCCFEQDAHDWLLGDDVDILPQLLLPLAGGEEFDDEDNDKLPLDLQYLPEDKQREKDAEIRLVERKIAVACVVPSKLQMYFFLQTHFVRDFDSIMCKTIKPGVYS